MCRRSSRSATTAWRTDYDLLTVLLHEIGHTIGLHDNIIKNRPVAPCTEDIPGGDPYFHIDPDLVGGANMSIKAFEQTEDFPIGFGGAPLDPVQTGSFGRFRQHDGLL